MAAKRLNFGHWANRLRLPEAVIAEAMLSVLPSHPKKNPDWSGFLPLPLERNCPFMSPIGNEWRLDKKHQLERVRY